MESKLKTIPLIFETKKYNNVFKDKNNKTLNETIETTRYKSLKNEALEKYSKYLNTPIGELLLALKDANDNFYQKFLNDYGDLEYSTFYIEDKNFFDIKGIYFYYINSEIKYIGRCKDNMKNRINTGYGKISPKNCFKDGQSTNCKVNSLVTKYKNDITLKILVLEDDIEIEKREIELIKKYNPDWNNTHK
jgi:hypothetical protein